MFPPSSSNLRNNIDLSGSLQDVQPSLSMYGLEGCSESGEAVLSIS